MHKYEIVIRWSKEDQLYLAEATELGCMTHGDSPESALRKMNSLIPFYLEVLQEEGRPIPPPKTKSVGKTPSAKFAARKQKAPRTRKSHVETKNTV